ncbi:MAG: hypothetical protein R6U66_03430 [Bacteroidales bacterium]
MNKVQHENSDALVLLGIIYASDNGKKQATLTQIIRACDFIEHVIITYDELKGGLVRLVNDNNIVEMQKLLFIPSDTVSQKFFEYSKSKKRSNAREDLGFIKKLVNAKEWDRNVNLVEISKNYNFSGLDYDIYDSSCKEYLGK